MADLLRRRRRWRGEGTSRGGRREIGTAGGNELINRPAVFVGLLAPPKQHARQDATWWVVAFGEL
jgi:hypothetical protein